MKVGELAQGDVEARCAQPGLAWEVGPFAVRLRTRFADIAREVALLYSQFPLIDGETVLDVELTVVPHRWRPWQVRILVDGEPQYTRISKKIAVPLIEWTLNVSVFQRPHQYFMLHSAVVASSDRAALLPGLAGQGKSTLCAGLAHRGWRLLSDEVAPILPSDGRVLPVPRPISLKNESIEIIRRFAPDAVIGPKWPGTSKGTVAHVLPPPDSVERAYETAEPAWLVFPSFRKGEAASLLPVTKAKALMRTADNSFNYSVLGRRGFDTLAALIDRCDCYDLVYGDLEAAVGLFDGLRREATPQPA